MSENNEQIDQTAEQGMEHAKKGAKLAAKPVRHAVKKAGKTVKKAAKKVGKKMALAFLKLIGTFFAAAWPIIIGLLVFFMMTYFLYDEMYETKGKNQEYQNEDIGNMNEYGTELDSNGDPLILEVSAANKLMMIFYGQFENQSHYALVNDEATVYRGDDTYLETQNVKDKYNREKSFILSPSFLYVLDEYLNEREIMTPETWIQPVAYEKDKDGNLALLDLTDKDGKLKVKSQAYDTNTGKAIKDKKIKGVWDYGFAPVFHYEAYTEYREKRGAITQDQRWDIEAQEIVSAPAEELGTPITPEEQSTKDVWLIDELVHPAGEISYKDNISYEWINTGQTWSRQEEYAVKVPVERIEYVQKINEDGKKLYYVPRYIWLRVEDEYFYDEENEEYYPQPPKVLDTKHYPEKPYDERYTYKMVQDGYRNELSTKKSDLYPSEWRFDGNYDEEERTFTRLIEGHWWEKAPEIIGDPEENIKGSKYFRDYFEYYQNYVPQNVMDSLNVKDRLNKSDEEIIKLLKDFDKSNGTGSGISADDLKLGENADSETYVQSLQNIELFTKYGEMFGVDPYILVAKAAQESGGSHFNSDGTVKWSDPGSGAIGIMQVENSGTRRSVSAYNYETNTTEVINPSPEELKDIETNIKWGTMYIANLVKMADYDFLVGFQSYNYGEGFISYAKEHNGGKWSQQTALDAQMKFAGGVLRNDPNSPLGPGNYGDAYYLEHVLRYYASPDSSSPWVKDVDGNKISMDDSSFEFGTVGSVNGTQLEQITSQNTWSKLKRKLSSFYQNAKESINKLLGIEEEYTAWQKDERYLFQTVINSEGADMILKQVLAFEEQKHLSYYDGMTEEDFKERFMLLFTHPSGKSIQKTEETMSINPKSFFPDGYVAPIDKPAIVKKYGYVKEKGKNREVLHTGIDLKVSKQQNIKAVADGKVIYVSANEVNIDHGYGVITSYAFMNQVKVKKGDTVKKGQVIGSGSNDGETKGAFHFGLRKDGKMEDPTWIVKPELLNQGNASGILIDSTATGHFQLPFPKGESVITSQFGWRDLYGKQNNHAGTDYVSSKGQGAEVRAIADGKVVTSQFHSEWGYMVVIDHGKLTGIGNSNVFSLYAHFNEASNVLKGQSVKKGQVIGKMGNTGISTGAHLHLQISVEPSWSGSKETTIDAEKVLPNERIQLVD